MAAKVKQRNATDRDYYRIVASVDNTTITLKGGPGLPMTVPKLARSQTFEFSTAADFVIEADQPILAFQYMPAWGNLSGAYDAASFPDGLPTGARAERGVARTACAAWAMPISRRSSPSSSSATTTSSTCR